ncbi:PilZ domain-containing protein [Rhodanobacter caeni]|jgi:hypothetical protein|uniref:PilZ domain-containing protein n=1 Tax=Rhodanobacter caeni TaxID=657654 RepID=A0ABN0UHY5_9GAMM
MNSPDNPANQRRSERKPINFTAVVTDVISGQPLGHLGNLSVGGMMLISSRAPRSEALYQVSLTLPAQPGLQPSQPIEVGIQEQWQAAAASPGQIWAGYRIVAISDADAGHLDRWLAQA